MLTAWVELDLVDNEKFNAGNSDYSATGQTDRDKLTTEQGWLFIDGDLE